MGKIHMASHERILKTLAEESHWLTFDELYDKVGSGYDWIEFAELLETIVEQGRERTVRSTSWRRYRILRNQIYGEHRFCKQLYGWHWKTIISIASHSVSAIYSTGDIKGNGVISIVQKEGAQNNPAGALCTADNSTKSGGEGEIHLRRVR